MLNPKALTSLLTSNRDGRLCKCWYIMTTNGTLLAYSHPIRVPELRRQAALAALRWMEHDRAARGLNRIASMISADGQPLYLRNDDADFPDDQRLNNPLHCLIVEDTAGNVLVQRLQDRLLLVLEGGPPPPSSRNTNTRITVQWMDGTEEEVLAGQQHARDEDSLQSQETQSRRGGGIAHVLLDMQRKKLDALAALIAEEFDQSGFVMPDDGGVAVF